MLKRFAVWSFNWSAARLIANPSDEAKAAYIAGVYVGMATTVLYGFWAYKQLKDVGYKLL